VRPSFKASLPGVHTGLAATAVVCTAVCAWDRKKGYR
jgi:hypothetical protein